MKTKELSIPPFLHDIHGERTSLFDLILTYGGAFISLSAVLLLYSQSGLSMAWWKVFLLLVICADVGAGAVANFTKGTNLYYSGKQKRKTRIFFILSHFLHPALVFFALEIFSLYSALLVVYVIGSTLLINFIPNREQQGVVAAFLTVAGISLLVISKTTTPILLWFFPLYMIKLFLAFGIRRFI